MMALKADKKYTGTVEPGSELIETQSGSLGYQVLLTCEDGDTFFIIWLTPKNRVRALKYFDILGVSKEKLANKAYLELQLGIDITGKEVSFGTRLEEYNGKNSVKVAWIGRKSAEDVAKAAADFFAAAPPVDDSDEPPVTDADLPF